MEGDEVLESMDSLWFYSSVFLLQPSSKHKQNEHKQIECPEELNARQQQDSSENHGMSSESSCQGPRCVKEVVAAASCRKPPAIERRTAAGSCRESDERVDLWLKKQRRPTRVVAVPARCSPAPMPPHDDGMAMKAHLRSWAHAVACSVR
ncbi:hypothetical protein EJB05_52944, partial [Eragrostis curvula]